MRPGTETANSGQAEAKKRGLFSRLFGWGSQQKQEKKAKSSNKISPIVKTEDGQWDTPERLSQVSRHREIVDSQLLTKNRETSDYVFIDDYHKDIDNLEWIRLLNEKKFDFRPFRGQK